METEALKIKHFTSGELKSLLRDDESFQQAIRLFACYQVSLGVSAEDIASFYGISHKSICNWVNRLNNGGIEALVDKEKSYGTSGKENDLQLIKEILIHKQPYDYGFNSPNWTWATLSKLIMHEFQISYKQAQVHSILKKLGLKF